MEYMTCTLVGDSPITAMWGNIVRIRKVQVLNRNWYVSLVGRWKIDVVHNSSFKVIHSHPAALIIHEPRSTVVHVYVGLRVLL